MNAWTRPLVELRNILRFLQPYLAREPLLLAAVLTSALFVMLFEGFGVGLLVPLLNLLLGGERATPMRPLQWLESTLPGQSPAFYIGAIAAAIVAAIALKNVALYTSLVLAARLKRRISVRLRDNLFKRLHSADLDLFDRIPGGDLANVFLVETYRTTVAVDAMLGAPATLEHRALLRRRALLPVVAADDPRRHPRVRASESHCRSSTAASSPRASS